MSDNHYKIAGNVVIPQEKKKEFNQYILEILYKGGIRKTEKMELGGKEVTVVSRPVPDSQGIVSFDYSIFENRKMETATYDTSTCELIAPNRGYQEFGLVMNMIMVMQEAYSAGQCYLMYEDRPCKVDAYVALIRKLLGINPEFSHRAKLWDMLLFLKNTEEYQNITAKMIWDTYSFDLCQFDLVQFMASYEIDSKEITVPQEPFQGEKDEIGKAPKGTLKYYIYQMIRHLLDERQEEGLELFLRELLDADLSGRKVLAENALYGVIAEASLYVLPSVIVHAWAAAVGRDFWDAWKGLSIKGYSEIIVEQDTEKDAVHEEDRRTLPFYIAIQREDEDEFLEFWRDKKLHLSEDMKECLSGWRRRFRRMHLEGDFDAEGFLTQIVVDLDGVWGCRLVDKDFVTEFLEHKDEENYKKALLLYREFMDEDTAYFPELTRKQANRWIVRNNRYTFDFTAMSAFQSLLINHKHRFKILGF